MSDPGLENTARLLKLLVGALSVVMIIGIITITTVLVMQFAARGPDLPENLSLPEGMEAKAVTFGTDWVGVVTEGDQFLIYHRQTGQLLKRITLD